jgi:hypothetical protein
MGVPITWEMLELSWRPSHDELFPYRYQETMGDDYQLGLIVEKTDYCVTVAQYSDANKP